MFGYTELVVARGIRKNAEQIIFCPFRVPNTQMNKHIKYTIHKQSALFYRWIKNSEPFVNNWETNKELTFKRLRKRKIRTANFYSSNYFFSQFKLDIMKPKFYSVI